VIDMTSKSITRFAAILLFPACTMIPKYERPKAPIPEALPAEPGKADAPAVANLHWQDYFTNPGMQSVIKLALANNRDLRIAALNVEKLQAAYGIQRAGLYPTVGVSASSQRYRTPANMSLSGKAMNVENDTANLGLSWELDFFGRVRSLSEQALNQYLATEQAQLSAQISLVATVAQQYVACAADNENLQLTQSTFKTQKAYYEMISQSRQLGIASDLDLRRAQSQVETARADVARFRGFVAVDQHALDLLVGTPVPAELLPKGFDTVGELRDVSAGLKSEVLLRRPDILMAEHQLKAANANIGAARAAFFPSISLTGGVGTMSPDLSGLFSYDQRTWSFMPKISLPIFAGGALSAGLKVSEINRDIAIIQYEQAIQNAFREVSDGLIRRATLAEQLAAQRSLLDSLSATYGLSETRYKEGLDGYLGVLDAQRSLYIAQQTLTAIRLASQSNQITLFKALGGQM
jgi:multidrug efflux system outer membrane protein